MALPTPVPEYRVSGFWFLVFGLGLQDVTKHGGSAYNLDQAENDLYGPPETSYKHYGQRSHVGVNGGTATAGADQL